jgi:hypothetical protein
MAVMQCVVKLKSSGPRSGMMNIVTLAKAVIVGVGLCHGALARLRLQSATPANFGRHVSFRARLTGHIANFAGLRTADLYLVLQYLLS